MKHQYAAFFCGCFVAKEVAGLSLSSVKGWKPEDSSIFYSEKYRHIYHDEFLNFCAAKSPDEGCVAWQYELNTVVFCDDLQGGPDGYIIRALHCYQMPFNIILFSIEVTMDTISLDDIKQVASTLRELALPQTVETILLNLNEFFTGSRKEKVRDVLEFGYRLKYFQIIHTDDDMDSVSSSERKLQLYQLSTMERDSSEWKTSFCDGYIERIVEEHILSVFNNWDALSLLDTFTIRAFQPIPLQEGFWRIDIYRMIYLQSLFQKFFLQHLNRRFRASICCRESYNLNALLLEQQQYERRFKFHKISYTFLPLLVDKAIDKGLEIGEEEELLTNHLEREHNRHQAANERLVGRLLMVISVLAMFSAIWDISCLIDQIVPYGRFLGSARRGYFGVSSLVLFIVVVVLGIVFLRMKRRDKALKAES